MVYISTLMYAKETGSNNMINWEGFFGHHCGLHYSAQQMEGVGGSGCENALDLEVSQV